MDSFGQDYQDARARFLGAARSAGAQLEAIGHPERGPDGGELAVDVAWLGSRSAERVLVLISATHGVEGFCGSGAQVDWLRRGEHAHLPSGVGALLIHAINPYGFAWLRRTTQENIDLNRNWVDFDQPLPANQAYAELREALVPRQWTDASRRDCQRVLDDYAGRHGQPAFQQAVSGGQYAYPDGIFYGGGAPSWSRTTQTTVFARYLAAASKVTILDYHTGLGPCGYAEPISVFAPESPEHRRARATFGANVTSVLGRSSSSAVIAGDGLTAAARLLPHAEVTCVALEYGTVPMEETLEALRADAWLHAFGDPNSPEGQHIKRGMKSAFYVDTDAWRGMVLGQSLQYCRMAVAAMGD